MIIWAGSPLLLCVDPTLRGTVTAAVTPADFLRNGGKLWLAIGAGSLVFRTVHLFFIKDVEAGLSWATKILTGPFHDIKLYWKSPLYLLRGELIDPHHVQHRHDDEELEDEDLQEQHAGA